jgi:hypothetical protein
MSDLRDQVVSQLGAMNGARLCSMLSWRLDSAAGVQPLEEDLDSDAILDGCEAKA